MKTIMTAVEHARRMAAMSEQYRDRAREQVTRAEEVLRAAEVSLRHADRIFREDLAALAAAQLEEDK